MIWKAIDSVRRLGNAGAHIGTPNASSDVGPADAERSIQALELLLHEFYVAPRRRAEVADSLTHSVPTKIVLPSPNNGSPPAPGRPGYPAQNGKPR
jgi:hypothetical protein